MSIRVRYAPSPTGLQHIGGIRTALFNYLFARAEGGSFILRIEDTDRTRYDESFVKNLYDTFDWLGFKWDEGPDAAGGGYAPYVQSERTEFYRNYAAELLKKGAAYRCFCTAERLETVRKEREAAKSPLSGYDRYCRNIPEDEASARAAKGEPFTIRLKIPLDDTAGKPAVTKFNDKLLGDIEWKNSDINPDPVLLKTDGFPTYHLANIVDDHLMGITHVLRAQEWLPSTPLHVILYESFGWQPPVFCHLPMVMGQDGKKLSKRHGATSIDEFRKSGYLPEALLNYIALLGASYEEGSEIMALPKMASLFSISKLNKAPAVFDYKKLEWFNAEYIKNSSNEKLADLALPFAIGAGLFGANNAAPSKQQKTLFINAMPLIKERALYLTEIPEKLRYLFAEPEVPPAETFIPKKASIEDARTYLEAALPIVEKLSAQAESWDAAEEAASALVKALCETKGYKLGDFLMPLRVAITGSRVSPPLFGSMRLLGAENSLSRVKKALSAIG